MKPQEYFIRLGDEKMNDLSRELDELKSTAQSHTMTAYGKQERLSKDLKHLLNGSIIKDA